MSFSQEDREPLFRPPAVHDGASLCDEDELFFPSAATAELASLDRYVLEPANQGHVTPDDGPIKKVRVIAIGSHLDGPLNEFARQVFGNVEIHKVCVDDVRGLSRQIGEYDILVILFNDPQRVKRTLRGLESFIRTKVCIGLTSQSKPKTRANLIRFAFDDVFDRKVSIEEITVRIASICARYDVYNKSSQQDLSFEDFCKNFAARKLNKGEQDILYLLFKNLHRVVRYSELANYDIYDEEYRIHSLRVRIHHLRKKLKGYEIQSHRGLGYQLLKIT